MNNYNIDHLLLDFDEFTGFLQSIRRDIQTRDYARAYGWLRDAQTVLNQLAQNTWKAHLAKSANDRAQ